VKRSTSAALAIRIFQWNSPIFQSALKQQSVGRLGNKAVEPYILSDLKQLHSRVASEGWNDQTPVPPTTLAIFGPKARPRLAATPTFFPPSSADYPNDR